jgi:hypothetical protein
MKRRERADLRDLPQSGKKSEEFLRFEVPRQSYNGFQQTLLGAGAVFLELDGDVFNG